MQEYETNISEFYKNVVKDGSCIVKETGEANCDLFLYKETIYSIPKKGSGAEASLFCPLSHLRRHLHHIQYVCNAPNIIPSYWDVIRPDVFEQVGISIQKVAL